MFAVKHVLAANGGFCVCFAGSTQRLRCCANRRADFHGEGEGLQTFAQSKKRSVR